MRLPATFDALRERNYRLFYAGLALSLIGTWMERAALSWLIYRITDNSEVWLGLAAGTPMIPALLLSIPAGALLDRVRVRTVLLYTQSLMCVGAAGIAALVLSGNVQPWHILIYIAYSSSVFAVDAPARHAFVVRLVGTDRITNAFALNAVAFQVAQVVGSAVFGVLMAYTELGEGGCLVINAGSFLCVLGSLTLIRETVPATDAARERPHPLEGLRHALRSPVIRAALLTSVITAMFGFQIGQLLPVYAQKVWFEGADGFAWLRGAMGAGALIGGVTLATRSATIVRGRLIQRYGWFVPPLLVAFAHAPTFHVALAVICVLGFLMIQLHSSCSSLVQSAVPDALRGRVSSLFTLSVLASFPTGGFIAGQVAERVGAPWTTSMAAVVVGAAYATIHMTHRELRTAA
jgi:predicted MFS family arabinose efflux permease